MIMLAVCVWVGVGRCMWAVGGWMLECHYPCYQVKQRDCIVFYVRLHHQVMYILLSTKLLF